MSEHHLKRIQCDECGKWLSGEELEVRARAERQGWIRIRWDMYGNYSDACGKKCEAKMRRDVEVALQGDGT